MQKEILVSVIIPNYNSSKTIKLCLDAVFNQNYDNFEVILVDDVSSDNSLEIASKYKCKIIKLKKNRGPPVARNMGVKHARGKILFFVDSDVALRKDALTVAVNKLKENKELGAVCGVYSKKPLINDGLIEEYRVLQDYYWKKSTEGYITTLNVANGAIRKDVYEEIGGFNLKLRISEDVEFGNRISQKYKILSTSKIIGVHDADDKLNKILKNFFKRTRVRVTLFMKRKKFNKGYATINRGMGCLFVGISLLLLVLTFININLLLVSLIFFIFFLLTDFGLYRFVLEEKKATFLIYFIFIHYLVNLSIFFGVALGFFDRYIRRIK